MRVRLFVTILICLFCSGCKTMESFLKKNDSIPVIKSVKADIETETVWVPAKTKKVWVNPHIDEAGNMIDGHYKYIILEEGHWALQEISSQPTQQQFKQMASEDKLKNE